MEEKSSNSQKTPQWLRTFRRVMHHGDRPWDSLLIVVSVFVLVIMVGIGLLLWVQSSNARQQFGLSLILPTTDTSWDPINNQFTAWPFIYGTLITSLVAIVIALPTGLGIAIFLAELCPEWLRLPLGQMVELLAAIPSVVYGLWGIFVFLPDVVTPLGNFLGKGLGFLPLFQGEMLGSGASRLAAGLILAIMIIPTIAAVSRDVFLAIPRSQREASLALGATQWETIWKVLIPYGLSGILGAIILGLGRAIGETMAVTMVIGNNAVESTVSLLRPGYTLSSIIANEFADAVTPLHTEVLIEVALILFVITLFLNAVARLLVWRVARRTPAEARA